MGHDQHAEKKGITREGRPPITDNIVNKTLHCAGLEPRARRAFFVFFAANVAKVHQAETVQHEEAKVVDGS